MNKPAEKAPDLSFRTKVIDVLREVVDPELGINVIDMGLIYSADIDEGQKRISVVMTLSSRGCPMGAAISGGIENVLQRHFPKYAIVLDLVWEPAWSYEFISAQGRQQLEL